MTSLIRIVAAAALAIVATPTASAEFTGFKLEDKTHEYGGVETGFYVLELYANFDNGNDTVVNVFGGEFFAISNFYQSDGASLPSKKPFYDTNGPFDSFVTIGFSYGGTAGNPDGPDMGDTGDNNATVLDPSFVAAEEGFLFGDTLDDPEPSKGVGWFNSNPTANNIQGKAGTYAGLKVLLARFTFDVDNHHNACLNGTLSLTYKPNNVGSAQVFDQMFELCVIPPTPGALALLALGPFASGRRRSP
jgi:hypothetical protein